MENPLSREFFVETHRVLTTLAFASYMLLAAQEQFAPNGDLFADTVSEMFKTRLADIVETKLPWLFLIYAVPSIIGLSIIMPPFQVADERAHTERADQLSRGRMISHRLGGTIDGGWVMIGSLYENMWFHLEVKQTVELAHEAGSIRWSGPKSKVNFPEHREIRSVSLRTPGDRLVARPSVRYPPRPDGGSSRVISGLAACAIGFLALLICRCGRALTFATLLLPMTLSQFGSASPDALLISLSILAVAMASRAFTEQRPASPAGFALFAFIVVATTLARPSQFAVSTSWTEWRD